MADLPEFKRIFMEHVGEMDCTNTQAAEKIGIDYRTYKSIMDYGKLPKPAILIRIADFFNISIDYLLGRTNNEGFEKSKNPQTFHERYEKLKKLNNMTDYQISQKLHISTSYTSAWKTHSFTPSLDNLIILSQEFDVSLDYLLGRTDVEKLD